MRTESRKWRKKRQYARSLSRMKNNNKIFQVFYLEKLYHNNLFFSFTVMYLFIFMTRKGNFILRAEPDRLNLFYQNIFVIVYSNQDILTA